MTDSSDGHAAPNAGRSADTAGAEPDHDRVLIRQVASEQRVSEQTIRVWFDRDRPESGRVVNGRRQPSTAWAASLPRRRAPGYSVGEAMTILGVSKMTVHRWFDRDAPESGKKMPGRGGTVRRCDPSWVEQMRRRVFEERRIRAGLTI